MGDKMEKKALTQDERDAFKRFLKAGIASAAVMTGIGALSKRLKAMKAKRDAMDISKQKNVIVVPIDKGAFLSGIPTPEEHKKALEGSGATKELAYDGDVDAAKKAILASSGRKFDFFGNRKQAEAPKEQSGVPNDDNAPEKIKETGRESREEPYESRPRDELGRFVSPTDPTAVESEKSAGWMRDAFMKPSLLIGTGALSALLATKIVDAINDIRKEKSKGKLDSARGEYVRMLENHDDSRTVKSAQIMDLLSSPVTTLGGSFLIPAAVAALVVNRIMDRRREDKKKAASMSSIPDEPIVVYNTIDSGERQIDPKTALSSFVLKRAMFIDAELAGMEEGAEKKAAYSDKEINEAVEDAVGMMDDPKNSEHLMGMVRAYQSGDNEGVQKAFSGMVMPHREGWKGLLKPINLKKLNRLEMYRSPQFRAALASNGKFHDMLVRKFDTDKSFMALRDQMIGNELGKTFKPGSWLYQIVQWLSKATGFGRSMFNDKLKSGLASFAAPKAK